MPAYASRADVEDLMIEVLDPTAEPSAPITDYDLRLTLRTGNVVGLCSNGFTDAAVFLDDIQAELGALRPGLSFVRYAKPTLRHSSFTMPVNDVKEFAHGSDAVIAAFGHCGSCTSAIMRDSAELAREGVPVATIVTTKFVTEARFVARATGIPALPIVVVPHPVAGRDAAYQRRLATEIVPALLEALATGRSPA